MSSEWRTVVLGECIELDTGFPFKSAEYVETPDAIRLLRGDNIGQGQVRWDGVKRWQRKEADSLANYELKENDLVLAMDRPWIAAGLKFARVRKGDLPALLVQRVARLRPRGWVDVGYLNAVLAGPDFTRHIQNVTTGTAVPHVSGKQIQEYAFKLPDSTTQKAIGALLMSIDDRITILRETNATLEAIAQALFKSWFVNFDPVRAKSDGQAPDGMDDDTAALFPDSFEKSALGLVPKGWCHRKLGDVCAYLNRGVSPKYVEDGGVLVVNQKCIRNFSVDYAKARRHDSLQRKIDGRSLVIGDVLVNSTGVGTLGRVAQVLALPEATIVDSHVTVVRAGAELSWSYLGQWMNRKQPEIEAMGEGSTGQTELSRSKLAELSILVPREEVLHAFDDCVKPIKQQMAVNEDKSKTLASLRDTLLPRLISGQLRLPDNEITQEAIAA